MTTKPPKDILFMRGFFDRDPSLGYFDAEFSSSVYCSSRLIFERLRFLNILYAYMKHTKKGSRLYLRNDVILISVMLLISALLFLYLFDFRSEGDAVKVTVDGELYGVFPLSRDTVEEIRAGDGVNRLVIKDGKAYVESASCPDEICKSHPPIFRAGESIICLPHRVVITVVTDEASGSPDIVA